VTSNASQWLSTGEVARLLGFRSVNSVKGLIGSGRLRARRTPGGHWRIDRADVDALLSATTPVAASGRPNLPLSDIAAIARRYRVRTMHLFGSAARGELRPDSDVDIVIELDPNSRVGLWGHQRLQRELTEVIGRPVDLVTWGGLRPELRPGIEREAIPLYAV
jgi:excisionase family DNA binding protein